MSEPFDIKKLLTSPFTGIYWVKVIMIGLGIFSLIVVIYTFWRAYCKKLPPTTIQTAEKIINHYYTLEPKQTFFGCASFRVMVSRTKQKEITKDEIPLVNTTIVN